MKIWKNAEVIELNIEATANGEHNWWSEKVDVLNLGIYETQTGRSVTTETEDGKQEGTTSDRS